MENFMDKSKPIIIHIYSHNPNPVCLKYRTPEEYISKHGNAGFVKIDKSPYWIGFFDDFNHKMSLDTMERTDKYNFECWRPYWNFIGKPYEKLFDGVYHRVFPSKEFKFPKIGHWHWSHSFLNELKKRIINNEKILLHLHDGHSNFMTWLILNLKPLNIPVLYQHRGGWFSNFDYNFGRKNPITLISYKKEKKMLKYVSHYFCGSRIEYDFLKNDLKINSLSFYMDGVDFNYFRPGDKKAIREKLGLPFDKKIILYVGRFDKINGVNNLLEMFKRLKENNNNVELLLVGGYKQNRLYQKAKDEGAILVERVPEQKLRDYYQAADIYSLASDDYFFQNFAGFGTATIHALACGVPVLSYNIIHLPGPMEEINKIGRIFNSDEELYQNAVYMLNNIDEFKNCREIAKKYYDKEETIKVLINKYDELLTQYYK
jgi:glycosyltransferase involved in cell wall biosynthesis